MPKTILVGSDLQFPYLDLRVYKAFVTFAREKRVDAVVLNGDINDFYSISSYDKDPNRAKRLVDELALMQETVFAPIRAARPKSSIYLTEGNHEDRLRRYIWKHAPALSGIPGLTIPELYKLKDYSIKYIPQDQMLELGCLRVLHGHLLSNHSAMTAKKHFDRHGTSVLVGHSHRLGAYYNTNHSGMHGAWEGGCLCLMDAEYENFPNWQQGWVLVHLGDHGFFHVELIPIVAGYVAYGGKETKL